MPNGHWIGRIDVIKPDTPKPRAPPSRRCSANDAAKQPTTSSSSVLGKPLVPGQSRSGHRNRASVTSSPTRVKHLQLRKAIVGATKPPTKLAVDILHHHHIRVDIGLVVRVKLSSRELVQQSLALRDDGR